jgi:hypothetical protein
MKEISVEDVGRPVLKSLAGRKAVMEIGVKVNNPTGKKLYLKKGEFEIFNKGYTFGKARLLEQTEIPAYSNDYQPVLLEISITDAMAIMKGSVHSILSDENISLLTFSGYIKGGTKLISKKYKFENMQFTGD